MTTLTVSESVREKNADEDPTKPDLKSSKLISCKLESDLLLLYLIATNTPTEMAIKMRISEMINFTLFSLTALTQENLNPLINEWDL